MKPSGLARAVAAAAIAAVTACSIWAALDDPYKNGPGFTDGGDSSIKGSADAGNPSNPFAAHVVEAGFIPLAIAAYDDTTYALEQSGEVYAAYDASTRFQSFWTGDAGGTLDIQRNGIAASASGVFWTLSTGVRYCAIDGGQCGLLASANAGAIAASSSVVAWIDSTGVRVCSTPVAGCNPTTLGASKSAARLAAGPGGSVAWTDGGSTIHLANGQGSASVDLQHEVSVVATDTISEDLYWEGPDQVGFLQFDGGGNRSSLLTSNTKPTALFAAGGVVYWSLANFSVVQHCRFDSSDMGCAPVDLQSGLPGPASVHGIAANSRRVVALVTSGMTIFLPELVWWPLP